MESVAPLAVIALAALVHASFQLSVSMLTLLSSHTLGNANSLSRLLRLSFGFAAGVFVMTYLLVNVGVYAALVKIAMGLPLSLSWSVVSGLAIGMGIAVWAFYYRPGSGTVLWLPARMSRFLYDRTKKTTYAGEAFSLGLMSVLAEIIFIAAPLLIASLAIAQLPIKHQVPASLFYTLLSVAPLLVTVMLINAGHSIARIQIWREANKRFLQFAAGSALIVLGFYLFVTMIQLPLAELVR